MKILVTGATGFIGSNLVVNLLRLGYIVYATHRTSSSFSKINRFKDEINWINTDFKDWKEKIKAKNIDQLIHVSWGGVEAGDRNNWELQINNFNLSKVYFDLAKECCFKKVIALGSQGEYGVYNYPTTELTTPIPKDAYGSVKVLTSNYLRVLFSETNTHWYWIRVYSVFGIGENTQWLVPYVIKKLLKKEPVILTACEQEYNYMYINDFVNQLTSVVTAIENKSGVYNICSKNSIVLKDLLVKILKVIDLPISYLKIGNIPYRENQNMFISGDNSKFIENFNFNTDLELGLTEGLSETIKYYKSKLE